MINISIRSALACFISSVTCPYTFSVKAAEFQEAKTKGITDGTGPCALAARAQAAVMTLRASKK